MTPSRLRELLEARAAQRVYPHGRVCSCDDCERVDSDVRYAAAKALPAFLALWEAAYGVYNDRAYDEAGAVCDVVHERMAALESALVALEALP